MSNNSLQINGYALLAGLHFYMKKLKYDIFNICMREGTKIAN